MNKLVSKNPIQRFKEGKKIYFYRNGTDKGGAMFRDTKTNNLMLDPRRQNWNPDDFRPSKRKFRKRMPTEQELKQDVNFMLQLNKSPKATNIQTKDTQSKVTKKTYSQNKSNSQKSQFENKGITNNIFIKGFQNRREEIKDVKAMQNQLIKLGLLKDKFGADGKWGKNTENAYQKYLQYLNNPSGISAPQTPTVERDASPWEQMKNTQENIPLYQRIRFKQGGQLISRNPVERFKSQKI